MLNTGLGSEDEKNKEDSILALREIHILMSPFITTVIQA